MVTDDSSTDVSSLFVWLFINVLEEMVLENIDLISVSNRYLSYIIFLQTDTERYFKPILIPIIVSVSI